MDKFLTIILFPFNIIATILDLFFCLPIIGRFSKWVWNSILTLIHLSFGLVEFGLMHLGFLPLKKIRLGIIVLNSDGNLLATQKTISLAVDHARSAFDQANIHILPANLVPWQPEDALAHKFDRDVFFISIQKPSPKRMLDVDCNLQALLQDLGLPGMLFQYATLTTHFQTAFRRVFGLGAPVSVFIVDNIPGFGGCSLGWISDYVTIRANHLACIAHEVGHACNLFHRKDKENLMYPYSCQPTHLTKWQIAMLRASRHVTLY